MKQLHFFCISLALSYCVNAQTIPSVDSLVLKEMGSRGIPGMAVAIIYGDEMIHQNAYGFAVKEHEVPVKSETTFELASLTKQFVAAGILLLVQDGKVYLDEPIKHYIDSLPSFWQELTLRRLLSHTAGLKSQEGEYGSLRPWPKYVSKNLLWKSAIQDSIAHEPGVKFSYHNTGYFLAELIIENVSGQDYQTFFLERIFNPLKMENTYFENQTKVISNEAQGYTIKNGELAKIWRVSQEEMAGGWGIWSNLDDLIKWNRAIDGDVLIKPEIQMEMFAPISLKNGSTFRYGLGWFTPKRNGLRYYYHNGITGPEILKIPSQDLTIIVLSNLGIGVGLMATDEPEPFGIADLIAGEIISEFRFTPQAQPISEKNLKALEGTFSFSYDEEVIFFIENEKLFIKDIYGTDEMTHLGNQVFTFSGLPATYYHFISPDSVVIEEEVWQDDIGIRKTE